MCVHPVSAEQAAVKAIRGYLGSFYMCWNTLWMPLQTAMRSPIDLYADRVEMDACGAANFALRSDNSPASVSSKNEIGFCMDAQTIGTVGVTTDAVQESGQNRSR
jgi:hypothetical protein